MNHDFPLTVCVLFALGLTGCERNDIKVYTIPKEQTAPTAMPNNHADHAAEPAAPQLKWKLPAGWKEGALSEFRVASFRIKGPDGKEADVSVVPLPGAAGGELSNVNRWRGQVSQPPVSDTELKALAQPIELAGQPAELYEQAGAGPNGEPLRILAVIQHRSGTAWFYKMTGDDQLVAQQKPVFVEFLKSLQFAANAPAEPAPNTGTPQWSPPVSWKEAPAGQFLVAKFVITGEADAQAAVNVSSSAGDGGGLVANVNRWRKQLGGLAEMTEEEIAKLVTTVGESTFAEMTGERGRLVAVIVRRPGQTWFYKLMGDAGIVQAQKDAFLKFVEGVRY